MPLNIVFHKTGTANTSGDENPQRNIPPAKAHGLYHTAGKQHDYQSQRQGTEYLHDADEAVAPEEKRIIPGAVQNHLTGSVDQQEDQADISAFEPFLSLQDTQREGF